MSSNTDRERRGRENVEDRIQQLEAMIRSQATEPAQNASDKKTPVNTESSLAAPEETFDLPDGWHDDPGSLAWVPIGVDTPINSNAYQLDSSYVPISSLDGIFSLPRVDGGSSVLSAINVINHQTARSSQTHVEHPSEELARLCHRDLPSAHEASLMLQEYLMDFNSVIPLFDRRAIALHFQDCYSGSPDIKGVSWGTLYVVLGIAHQLRAMSPLATEDDNITAIRYLDRCMKRLPELLMDTPSLALIQCLLGVAIIIKGTPRSRSAALFVSIAMRLAQDLGYNEKRPQNGGGVFEAEQENLVFWIAFLLDSDHSLRSNRLPTQSYEHIDADLPDQDPTSGAGIVRADVGNLKANILRLRVEMSLVQAEIMEELFSVKARRKLVSELTRVADMITLRLHQWRDNWIFQVHPYDLRRMLQRSEMVHVLVLEAAYFTTNWALQAEIIQTGHRTDCSILISNTLTQKAATKEPPCYPHARRLLELVVVAPSGDIACTWYANQAESPEAKKIY
ncbi:uncharacterized protein A1O9_09004 [Exophiala aquamarina CBS 119918]|uniref:Xylanolytic transcriptional activator regulatory domain-containing protein n=1 Tax=Exophiala aquamarina CBS 119918 TaxID=1182545 RepID=A0A072P4C7_9EURO|nr:uncharacterized protein A1O9_09004 [Exophiala aquamarina CBS 119918]KEF54562.1 hypothetical protein A1O9_09004 [Exophiala aquamarina CBS 119918]